jgi:hypothetical protein
MPIKIIFKKNIILIKKNNMQINKIYWADKLGITSAFLCLIHCIVFPFLLTLNLGFLSNPIISFLFVGLSLLSIYKVTQGKFLEKKSIFLWLSFFGLISTILLEEVSIIFEYFVYFFSVCIIFGHLYNVRNCLKA